MQYLSVIIIVLACAIIIKLLIGKVKQRTSQKTFEEISPSIGNALDDYMDDGIVAVRKPLVETELPQTANTDSERHTHFMDNNNDVSDSSYERKSNSSGISVMHIMAQQNKLFAGYELLQAILSSGLRFGEMNIFHRYREPNTQKGILFSLASATEPGVFDMLNMGAFSCKGLTLFMRKSEDEHDNRTRYELMLSTAQHLAEDLDGMLLDESRNLLSLNSANPQEESKVSGN